MPSLSEETRGAVTRLMPGATIGIVGGGQLGRMMALSAKYMGFRVGVLDPTPDCPTAQVGDFQIVAAYDDKAAIRELAAKSDVLTYEFENVDADALDEVRGSGEGQCAVPQGTDLLRVTQNRIAEKSFINDHGIATAPWRAVNSRADLPRSCCAPPTTWNASGTTTASLPRSWRVSSTSRSRPRSLSPATASGTSPSRLYATCTGTTSCT